MWVVDVFAADFPEFEKHETRQRRRRPPRTVKFYKWSAFGMLLKANVHGKDKFGFLCYEAHGGTCYRNAILGHASHFLFSCRKVFRLLIYVYTVVVCTVHLLHNRVDSTVRD